MRKIKRFAWLPRETPDGFTHWLEWIEVTEEFSVSIGGNIWVEREWRPLVGV